MPVIKGYNYVISITSLLLVEKIPGDFRYLVLEKGEED
jgi:hypothetical protein